ncbi:hypothetical protein E4K72_09730 [Oxalobacteraceae bacterium OM1]|nr:hypothetical protein E4K72_09730 [Oxalobacteraceae bacterium OM1]
MHRRLNLTLLFALTLLSGCSVLQGGELYAPETFGLVPVAPNVYIERDADDRTKAILSDAAVRAHAAITHTFGDAQAAPVINACVTERCFWSFGGRGEFAKVYGKRILLSPRALNWHFIAHEWSHAEMSTRLNVFAWKRMPQWFDDGLAVTVSEAPEHSEQHWRFLVESNIPRPGPDELHSLKSLGQWLDAVRRYSDNKNIERRARGEQEIHSVYAAAGHEVRPWLVAAGTPGLLALIQRLNDGETFERAYDAGSPKLREPSRVAPLP